MEPATEETHRNERQKWAVSDKAQMESADIVKADNESQHHSIFI